MKTTKKILLSMLLASTAGFGVACTHAKTSEEAASGEDAVVEGSGAATFDADAIERRMTCIHHRRERTKVNGKPLTRAFHLKSHGCVKGTMTIDPPAEQSEGARGARRDEQGSLLHLQGEPCRGEQAR